MVDRGKMRSKGKLPGQLRSLSSYVVRLPACEDLTAAFVRCLLAKAILRSDATYMFYG